MDEMKFNPIALRKAKIVHNFGLSESNWIKPMECQTSVSHLTKADMTKMKCHYFMAFYNKHGIK